MDRDIYFDQEFSKQENGDSLRYTANLILTGREKQVLRLLVDGLLYKQIASKLDISVKTVGFHTSKILRKLQVKDRFELADVWHMVISPRRNKSQM